jgi:hypothetical protein
LVPPDFWRAALAADGAVIASLDPFYNTYADWGLLEFQVEEILTVGELPMRHRSGVAAEDLEDECRFVRSLIGVDIEGAAVEEFASLYDVCRERSPARRRGGRPKSDDDDLVAEGVRLVREEDMTAAGAAAALAAQAPGNSEEATKDRLRRKIGRELAAGENPLP